MLILQNKIYIDGGANKANPQNFPESSFLIYEKNVRKYLSGNKDYHIIN